MFYVPVMIENNGSQFSYKVYKDFDNDQEFGVQCWDVIKYLSTFMS